MIVISRHRPRHLARCLAALTWQDHPAIEVILVADPASVQVRPDLPIKRVAFDQANIAAARNQGLALAAGEVALFIDDDALAEPSWAGLLTEAFTDPRVVAATGFTRGPDGLSWQARAERINRSARSYAVEIDAPTLVAPDAEGSISTIGTNCAFRRAALVEIGGFDPAFSYHLDESVVNLRLAARFRDGLTAVLPAAEVIHGLAPGTSRAQVGVPSDLSAIGRSTAIFAARHGGSSEWLRRAQQVRLLRHMVAGRLDPFAVRPILDTLERGLAEGRRMSPEAPRWDHPPPPGFLRFETRPSAPLYLEGWHWQARELRRQAARGVSEGRLVHLLLLTPSFLPHRKILREGGWWEQVGGIWGMSRPGDSALVLTGRAARVRRERAFFAAMQRQLSKNSPFDGSR